MSATRTSFEARLAALMGVAPSARPAPAAAVVASRKSRRSMEFVPPGEGMGGSLRAFGSESDNRHLLHAKLSTSSLLRLGVFAPLARVLINRIGGGSVAWACGAGNPCPGCLGTPVRTGECCILFATVIMQGPGPRWLSRKRSRNAFVLCPILPSGIGFCPRFWQRSVSDTRLDNSRRKKYVALARIGCPQASQPRCPKTVEHPTGTRDKIARGAGPSRRPSDYRSIMP